MSLSTSSPVDTLSGAHWKVLVLQEHLEECNFASTVHGQAAGWSQGPDPTWGEVNYSSSIGLVGWTYGRFTNSQLPWCFLQATKYSSDRAVASPSLPGGQDKTFPQLQCFLIFLYFLSFFLKFSSFSSSFWSSGWATRPPGKALATPLSSEGCSCNSAILVSLLVRRKNLKQVRRVLFINPLDPTSTGKYFSSHPALYRSGGSRNMI